MKKITFLLVALIMCGYLANAQTQNERLSSIKTKHSEFVAKQEANKAVVKPIVRKDYPKNETVEKYLLDSVYRFEMPLEADEYISGQHYYTYDDYGRETNVVAIGWYYATQNIDTAYVQNFVYDENGNVIQESQLDYQYDYDSGLVLPNSGFRNNYTYDDYGNQSVIITEYYETGEWFLDYKYVTIFDANGNITNQESYSWSSSSSLWSGISRTSTTYNEAGKITEETMYEWQEIEWVVSDRYEYIYNEFGSLETTNYYFYTSLNKIAHYTYDENNLLILLIEEGFNFNYGAWFNEYKTTYSYNTDNQLSEETEYYWNINDLENQFWENSELYTYAYDTYGNLNEKITNYWDGETWGVYLTETWVYDSQGRMLEYTGGPAEGKYEWAYDEFDNLILYVKYIWFNPGKVTGEWMILRIEEYEYNADNVLIMEYYSIPFNAEGYKTEYTYENDFLIEKIEYEIYGPDWQELNYFTYTYDENDNLAEILVKYWDWNTGAWGEDGYRDLFYFSLYEVIAEIATEKLNSEISVYPNPATNLLNFNNISENAVISVYDLTGKQVSTQLNSNNQIDLSSLTKGIYLIKIIDNSEITTAKFVKQ